MAVITRKYANLVNSFTICLVTEKARAVSYHAVCITMHQWYSYANKSESGFSLNTILYNATDKKNAKDGHVYELFYVDGMGQK